MKKFLIFFFSLLLVLFIIVPSVVSYLFLSSEFPLKILAQQMRKRGIIEYEKLQGELKNFVLIEGLKIKKKELQGNEHISLDLKHFYLKHHFAKEKEKFVYNIELLQLQDARIEYSSGETFFDKFDKEDLYGRKIDESYQSQLHFHIHKADISNVILSEPTADLQFIIARFQVDNLDLTSKKLTVKELNFSSNFFNCRKLGEGPLQGSFNTQNFPLVGKVIPFTGQWRFDQKGIKLEVQSLQGHLRIGIDRERPFISLQDLDGSELFMQSPDFPVQNLNLNIQSSPHSGRFMILEGGNFTIGENSFLIQPQEVDFYKIHPDQLFTIKARPATNFPQVQQLEITVLLNFRKNLFQLAFSLPGQGQLPAAELLAHWWKKKSFKQLTIEQQALLRQLVQLKGDAKE